MVSYILVVLLALVTLNRVVLTNVTSSVASDGLRGMVNARMEFPGR